MFATEPMLGLQYTTMALNHCKKGRRELRAPGTLNEQAWKASRLASEYRAGDGQRQLPIAISGLITSGCKDFLSRSGNRFHD
jgi:hypothetical protein